MRHSKLSTALSLALTLTAGAVMSCAGGGGSSPSQGGFQLVSISMPPGAIWPINKRIELEFNQEIDITSVMVGSTLVLKSTDLSGASAFFDVDHKIDPTTGAIDQKILVIQPFCPLESDLSDAGLMPGNIQYQLRVPGTDSGSPPGAVIRSQSGASLEITQDRTFFTPDSLIAAEVFEDTVIGPPAVVAEGTFVRLGDGSEIPFVFTGAQHDLGSTEALPLNLYSDALSSVMYLVQLNQAVDPSDDNLDDALVRLEFLDGGGIWQPFQTGVELESNCALDKPGALLRLTPMGILPQDTQIRVTLASGFTDLSGEQNLADQTDFFAPTAAISFSSLTPADGGADEVFEDFSVAEGLSGSFQDVSATFETPSAVWEEGALTAAFDFQGSGGPAGTFDWFTPPISINFNTDFDTITGGVDGNPVQTIPVVAGVVDVNDLWVQPGTYLRVLAGDNPLTIIATGDVIIEGTIDISGFDAKQVGTLFTPNMPEPGSDGPGGGGKGGTGSYLTSSSTPFGGNGDGPFGIQNAGGFGGEAGYTNSTQKQHRRGAGGGGGRFAPDFDTNPGMEAEQGGPGHPLGFGATSGGKAPAVGGLPGPGPFIDADLGNDFFGKQGIFTAGILTGVVNGELGVPFAGYGGGAGGDAINFATFPTIPFGPPYKDKKGAGGGGGGGQLRIFALGRIIFRDGGRILSDGGDGATGENVLGFDHIAGSSAGASGGHILLESATQIDFTDGGLNQIAQEYVQCRGGIGGIPKSTTEDYSGGGNGGPGVIQLHVPDSDPATAIGTTATDAIRIPVLSTLSDLTKPTGHVLIPTFGARSKARSRWIPMGGAAVTPAGGFDPLLFAFEGSDSDPLSATPGQILTTSEVVDTLAELIGSEALGSAAPDPFVDTDGFTLVLSEASLLSLITNVGTPKNDIYLRNPALLRNFTLRLSTTASDSDFNVSSATYSDTGKTLSVTVDTSGASLEAFVTGAGSPGAVEYHLIPRFFEAETGLIPDRIPDTGYVRVLFQATGVGADGLPDEANPLVDWTPDITEFNVLAAGTLEYYRFEVEFNLDAAGVGLTVNTEPIGLNFFRNLFSF